MPSALNIFLQAVLPGTELSMSLTVVGLVVLFYASIAIYNVTFHPLARVPGYKMAGMTKLYQLFWCYHNGRSVYYKKIHKMHAELGPIVRVSPNEISLQDPKDCDKIYAAHSRYTKDTTFYRTMGVQHGMFGAGDNSRHQQLRAPWRRFFSNASIRKLDDMILSKTNLMCQRMDEQLSMNGSAPVQDLLHSLSSDIVSQYTMPDCLGLLQRDGDASVRLSQLFSQAKMIWIFSASPVIFYVTRWLTAKLSDLGLFRSVFGQISQTSAAAVDACLHQKDDDMEYPASKSLAHVMVASYLSPDLHGQTIITRDVLIDELHSQIVAGSFNAGTIASVTLFHILTNGDIHHRLLGELGSIHKKLTHSEAEKLPYLSACIKEGLRLGYGPIGRLPRVVPEPGACFQGYKIPAGSVVGVSSYVQHHNPAIWGTDHDAFNPDRWLDPGRSRLLDKHLLTFGKDSRRCIGQRLAEATLYVGLASILLKFPDAAVHGDYPVGDFDDHFAAVLPSGATRLALCRNCCKTCKAGTARSGSVENDKS